MANIITINLERYLLLNFTNFDSLVDYLID